MSGRCRRANRWGGGLLAVLSLVLASCSSTPAKDAGEQRREPGPEASAPGDDSTTEAQDAQNPAVRTVRAELRVFTDWLARFGARGYIGEVGWPGIEPESARYWNELGEAWYRDADAAGLWVSYWSSGEWWPADYALAIYRSRDTASPMSEARDQAEVIERHGSTASYSRGVTVSGAEFGAPSWTPERDSFSNANPGTYGEDWHYDSPESFAYLASRGHRHVRLPFRWERIQPSLGGELDRAEIGRLNRVVDFAHAAGLGVILDVHNFASYRLVDPVTRKGVRRAIGSPQVTPEHFYDLWRRLSAEFRGNPGIVAYGLMNEPVDMPGAALRDEARLWERVSQRALEVIRAEGDMTLITVPGYGYSAAHDWSERHPRPWIRDPADNFRYEAHHYFDADHSGEYEEAAAAGEPTESSPSR